MIRCGWALGQGLAHLASSCPSQTHKVRSCAQYYSNVLKRNVRMHKYYKMPIWKKVLLSVVPLAISIPLSVLAIYLINRFVRWW